MAEGLFGPSPWEIQQAQQQGLRQQAAAYAKQSPMERAAAGMYQAGGMLGGMGAEALGGRNIAVENARRTEQIMGEGDTDLGTAAGLFAKAKQFMDAGDRTTATKLLFKANEFKRQEAAAAIASRKQDTLDAAQLSLTKLQAAQAEKALRENPNLKEIEVGVAGKPDYRQKMIIDSRDPNAKPVLVGEPYQIAAGVRVDARSAGGGGFAVKPVNIIRDGRAITIDANTGQEIGLTAQYDPVTRSAISSATAIGKSAGEATAAIPAAKINIGLINKAVDDLIAMPGFSSAVGATLKPGAQYIPGTKEADWRAQFKQVQGQTFNVAYETLRGGGQITEYETKSAGAALNAMSSATTERQFIKASKDFKAAVQAGLSKLEARAALQPRGVTASTAGKTVNWGDLK